MAGLSRGALQRRLAPSPSAPAPAEAVQPLGENEGRVFDARSHALASRMTVDADYQQAVSEVFKGTGFLEDGAKVEALLAARAEVNEHWSGMRDSFLAIGRALVALDERLTRAEIQCLQNGTERLFPFSRTVAAQLRAVAQSVDNGRLQLETCPGTYSTAYQLAQLNDDQLQKAREAGLIRTDVTRAALIEFRKRVTTAKVTERFEAKSTRRRRLQQRRDRLRIELAGIEATLAEMDREGGR